MGSSPHVRGARLIPLMLAIPCGIIPACAGSTNSSLSIFSLSRDHPRMCGEHHILRSRANATTGSSPHVRGALLAISDFILKWGIIPACAGSTIVVVQCFVYVGDHPRMCGEHSSACLARHKPVGSSPHVRGALAKSMFPWRIDGIIPACAGSTVACWRAYAHCRDHPRMCGEHTLMSSTQLKNEGSSPHVRGAHRTSPQASHGNGIIPACAGSTTGSEC